MYLINARLNQASLFSKHPAKQNVITELREEQVPTFQQIADYERNLELASTE